MSDERRDQPPDGGPDTERFRAFVEGGEESRRPVGVPFRVVTLLAGLAAFVLIVLLLLR